MSGKIQTGIISIVLNVIVLPAVAQTCIGNVTITAPDSRYTDNRDSTVTDHRTALMWQQCSEGLSTNINACDTGAAATYTWQAALQQAQVINSSGFAGYSDWRLPNRNELASLVEYQCYFPSINESIFPNTIASKYWSSSPYAGNSTTAFYVEFSFGTVQPDIKNASLNVRFVRSGQ